MVLAEKIKSIEASFTWPHPTEKGRLVSALFLRLENDIPYLLYCPICKQETKIEEVLYRDNDWFRFSPKPIKDTHMTTSLYADGENVQFYIIPLTPSKPLVVSKKDIEKLFNIKVTD